jgi:hypothetical protein
MTRKFYTLCAALALFTLAPACAAHAKAPGSQACAELAQRAIGFADPGTRIVSAVYHPDGVKADSAADKGPALPAHCEVIGAAQSRGGRNGQAYAIRFHMRLPTRWNDRFVFEGGGGLNGQIGNALGSLSNNAPVAVAQGYAVVSQDSGHDGSNADPAFNGEAAFGFDPVARENYGHASLRIVADAAKAIIRAYFGRAPRYSYFIGCSKGGQEGMMFAQRYPTVFDGILASAPGFSLPRAAIAQTWDTASFANIVRDPVTARVSLSELSRAFSADDLQRARTAILKACDDLDGLADGIVADARACTTPKVMAQLKAVQCAEGRPGNCLSAAQLDALLRVMQGPRDSAGRQIYSDWLWPASIASDGWRYWKLGSADGAVPPLNVLLGGPALASLFSMPPKVVGANPQAFLDYQLGYDFDRDAATIYSVQAPFRHSPWEDIGARSPNLDGLRAHKAKLLVPHGDADPVFSLADTEAWFDEVNARYDGGAADFVRVFPVPGMCHCGGGVTTDQYDAFSALKSWVEGGVAPDRIVATAAKDTPWPGRTRPLCPYPLVARYKGTGDIEAADSFVCKV